MSPIVALLAFSAAGAILTVTPGLDTVLVLRTAMVEGSRRAAAAALGICCGLLVWGMVVALGLGALLAASRLAYAMLQWLAAGYLLWLGLGMLVRPEHDRFPSAPVDRPNRGRRWFIRGLLTNLMNPKVGAFYITFLPQFVPEGTPVAPFVAVLASIHVAEGAIWFMFLILATRPLMRTLGRAAVARWLNRLSGTVIIGFGLRLALERP